MEESLNFLYTGDLRGNLEKLPRLYTFIKSLRGRMDGRTILLDLGGACDASVWHCEITGGRSMIVALDGMGCAVANVSGYLSTDARAKLGDNLAIALVDEQHTHVVDDLIFTIKQPPTVDWDRLAVRLIPTEKTWLENRVLSLVRVNAGQVGRVSLERADGVWGITTYSIHDLPAVTPPDPTIAGAVEFITAEARYAQKKQG